MIRRVKEGTEKSGAVEFNLNVLILDTTQENKSNNGSDQPTKPHGIPGNESTNGSDGSALFSLRAN